MRTYGYAHVSSSDQSLQGQLDVLMRMVYRSVTSSLIKNMSLDRLDHDCTMIKDEYRELHYMGVCIVILDMPILSTIDKSDLKKSLIANIVFELLAYTAEREPAT